MRKVVVLHGLGGIGKTQLASHFARIHQSDFTAIFWLNAKDRHALIQSLAKIPSRISQNHVLPIVKAAKNEQELEERAQQALQWLGRKGNSRWLLIFDNVDHHAPLEAEDNEGYDVSKLFPSADHGSIIITTRLVQVAELGKSQPVEKLARQEGVKLLTKCIGRKRVDDLELDVEDQGALFHPVWNFGENRVANTA
jgi:hypothetical protein